MRWMIIAFMLFISIENVNAQINEISLVVSGEGATKKEATTNALRNAVEQAFGTFVSSNTSILGDDIISDEIATISSGNIRSYEELSDIIRDSIHVVSLKAIVSVKKLISYVKNQGTSVDFSGNTFTANLRLFDLNKENELVALKNLSDNLSLLAPYVYDFKINVEDPVIHNDNLYRMKAEIIPIPNKNFQQSKQIFLNTLKAISVKKEEEKTIKKIGKNLYQFHALDTIFIFRNPPIILKPLLMSLREDIMNSMLSWNLKIKTTDNVFNLIPSIGEMPCLFPSKENLIAKEIINNYIYNRQIAINIKQWYNTHYNSLKIEKDILNGLDILISNLYNIDEDIDEDIAQITFYMSPTLNEIEKIRGFEVVASKEIFDEFTNRNDIGNLVFKNSLSYDSIIYPLHYPNPETDFYTYFSHISMTNEKGWGNLEALKKPIKMFAEEYCYKTLKKIPPSLLFEVYEERNNRFVQDWRVLTVISNDSYWHYSNDSEIEYNVKCFDQYTNENIDMRFVVDLKTGRKLLYFYGKDKFYVLMNSEKK